MPRVQLTWESRQDLKDLFDYIAEEDGPDRAQIVLRRLDVTLQSLAAWPGIGRQRRDLDGAPRSFSVWPWLIIYEPLPTGEGVYIWRIVDGRRDLAAIIHPPVD